MKKRILLILSLGILLVGPCYGGSGDLDSVLSNAAREGKAVMLELGSVGCVPCEQMKPVMEKLKADHKDKIKVFFIDVRKDRDAAKRFRVYVIPTQIFLDKNGKEFHRHIGYYGYEEIAPLLREKGL